MISNRDVKSIIRNSMKLDDKSRIDEALVAQTKTYDLKTEFLSAKNKQAHKELYEGYIKSVKPYPHSFLLNFSLITN